MSGLQSWSGSILKSISCPPYPHFVSSRDTTLLVPTAQIFYRIWRETLQAATSTRSGLRGNRLMHLLCTFHTCACYPWRVMLTRLV